MTISGPDREALSRDLVRRHDRPRYYAGLFSPARHRGALFALLVSFYPGEAVWAAAGFAIAIVTGHIASDSVGINPYVERLRSEGLDVTTFSGILPA